MPTFIIPFKTSKTGIIIVMFWSLINAIIIYQLINFVNKALNWSLRDTNREVGAKINRQQLCIILVNGLPFVFMIFFENSDKISIIHVYWTFQNYKEYILLKLSELQYAVNAVILSGKFLFLSHSVQLVPHQNGSSFFEIGVKPLWWYY